MNDAEDAILHRSHVHSPAPEDRAVVQAPEAGGAHDRSRAHAARSKRLPVLRGARRGRIRRFRMARVGREHRVRPLLYVGDHGQSEGRPLQSSLDGASCLRHVPAGCDVPVGARLRPAVVRCSMPTPCCVSAPLVGAKLVVPGAATMANRSRALREEKVTFSAGVPTVWNRLIHTWRDKVRLRRSSARHRRARAAGDDPRPRGRFDRGEPAWGMTEMSPLGSVCKLQEALSMPSNSSASCARNKPRGFGAVGRSSTARRRASLGWEAFGTAGARPWVIRDYYKSSKALIDGGFPRATSRR